MLLEGLSVYESLTTRAALVGPVSRVEIAVVGEPALLGEPLSAHIASVRSFPGVYPHVSDKRVVYCELALADLTTVRLLVRVRSVVQGQLMLFIEAGRALIALELPLGMQIQMLHVLLLVQETLPTLPTLVGFDTVNTDHMGSELAAVAERGVTVLAVVFSFVEETTV